MTGTLPDNKTKVEKTEKIEEIDGNMSSDFSEDKLLHSVLEGDKDSVEDAKIIEDSINNGLGSFSPDLMMAKFVKDFKEAKELFGETLIRLLSSYNPDYIEKNIRIPEFQRELQKQLEEKIDDLKKKNILNSDGEVTKTGVKMASLILLTEELDHLTPKGFTGERVHKKQHPYGIRNEIKNYKTGDRYADIAIKNSISRAIKRGHKTLMKEDLRTFSRKSKGNIEIIYGMDASGSMKGKKIEAAKKAGVALSFKAIEERNKVGLLVFETEITKCLAPSYDFQRLLETMTEIRANKQTDFQKMISKSLEMFSNDNVTKHLVLLTDALPTVGDDPQKQTLQAVSQAKEMGITVSVIGLQLDKEGEKFAKEISAVSNGKFYVVRDLDNLDSIILDDYYSFA